jgi:hypothetical protein
LLLLFSSFLPFSLCVCMCFAAQNRRSDRQPMRNTTNCEVK